MLITRDGESAGLGTVQARALMRTIRDYAVLGEIAQLLEVAFEDRVRANSFGDDPTQYNRTRPGYPSKPFDDLLRDGECNRR